MPKVTVQEEMATLREELKRLQALENTKNEETEDLNIDGIIEDVMEMEGNMETKAQEVLERMKIDYENMSPATAVAIFAAGALFGRIFMSK